MWTDGQGFFYFGDCRIGDREATPEEVAARQPDPKDAIRAQIRQLEAEQLLPRVMREFSLAMIEKEAVAYAASISTEENIVTVAEVLALNPGYQSVKAFDNQIKALRAQL